MTDRRTFPETTWKANWLVEFGLGLVALGFLTRELIITIIGVGVACALIVQGLAFHRKVRALRTGFRLSVTLSKKKAMLGESIEGELGITHDAKVTARVLNFRLVNEKALIFKRHTSSEQYVKPGTTSRSKFTIVPSARGRFGLSQFILTVADKAGLFRETIAAGSEEVCLIEVYSSIATRVPTTPLSLYGGLGSVSPLSTGDYGGIREYTPGEEYHRIEWRTTARLRRLMVKQFHPETEAVLHILIDAGSSMQRTSYVGTRLDEALAVAQLVVESISESGSQVGIWIYDETEVVKALRPQSAIEQLSMLRNLAITLKTKTDATQTVAHVHPRMIRSRAAIVLENAFLSKFVDALTFRMRLGLRRTGVYKAISKATWAQSDNWLIVLTDLETNAQALLEAVSRLQDRILTVVAQIGTAWRFRKPLEDAYVEFRRNRRLVRRFEESGLIVFDVRPESLIEAITTQISAVLATPTKRV